MASDNETPKYLLQHENKDIALRTYLRVLLSPVLEPMPRCSATVWLMQLGHIKTGSKGGPSYLGTDTLNRKIRMFAAIRNHGSEAAAELNKKTQLFAPASVVPVTLGDQNLTEDEVLLNPLSRSLVKHRYHLAASPGIWDNGRCHHDLIAVDADRGVEMVKIHCNIIGFDGTHQAVRARLSHEPTGREVAAPAAASAEAAQAAASTRGGTLVPLIHLDPTVAAQEGSKACANASALLKVAAPAAASTEAAQAA